MVGLVNVVLLHIIWYRRNIWREIMELVMVVA